MVSEDYNTGDLFEMVGSLHTWDQLIKTIAMSDEAIDEGGTAKAVTPTESEDVVDSEINDDIQSQPQPTNSLRLTMRDMVQVTRVEVPIPTTSTPILPSRWPTPSTTTIPLSLWPTPSTSTISPSLWQRRSSQMRIETSS